jgi:hypothetical protein
VAKWKTSKTYVGSCDLSVKIFAVESSENFHHILGSVGEPERVEPEHEQADGPRHEDHSPHQQGGDGQF